MVVATVAATIATTIALCIRRSSSSPMSIYGIKIREEANEKVDYVQRSNFCDKCILIQYKIVYICTIWSDKNRKAH